MGRYWADSKLAYYHHELASPLVLSSGLVAVTAATIVVAASVTPFVVSSELLAIIRKLFFLLPQLKPTSFAYLVYLILLKALSFSSLAPLTIFTALPQLFTAPVSIPAPTSSVVPFVFATLANLA